MLFNHLINLWPSLQCQGKPCVEDSRQLDCQTSKQPAEKNEARSRQSRGVRSELTP